MVQDRDSGGGGGEIHKVPQKYAILVNEILRCFTPNPNRALELDHMPLQVIYQGFVYGYPTIVLLGGNVSKNDSQTFTYFYFFYFKDYLMKLS